MKAAISIRSVSKHYAGGGESWAVRGVTLNIFPGEVTVLMGPSGSGKTTLLSMIGGVLSPTEGEINVCGVELERCDEKQLQLFRRAKIGFIFQSFNLLSALTARENIELALSFRDADLSTASDLLDRVGLIAKAGAYPMQLSGGQRQRVGIARALAGDPPVLLADEPTAALDAFQGRRVMDLLRTRAKKEGTTVLVVTHDPRVREFADRVVEMEDGTLKRIVRRMRPELAADGQWMIFQKRDRRRGGSEHMKPEPRPMPISHDLLEAEEARAVLNMPQAKFELLLSSGQLPIFRSNGKTCFRREDIAALALKRQANAAKSVSKSAPVAKIKTPTQTPVVKPAVQPRAEQIDEEQEQFEEDRLPVAASSHRKWLPWVVGAGALAAIVIAVFTFLGSNTQNAEAMTGRAAPTQSAFTKCKAAPGLVEALSGERPLSFEVAGKLHSIAVDEGQTIKIGDPIAELENADLVAKLKSSQADLSAAEASLGILKGNLESDLKKSESEVARLSAELVLLEPRREDIEQARADAAAAEADSKRMAEDEQKYSDPHGRGTSWSVQLYDQSRRLSEAASAKYSAAKSRLHAMETGSRPEEKDRTRAMLASAEAEVRRQKATSSFALKSAEAQVDRAHAQVDLAKAELDKTRIASTINGTVVRKYMHPGEVIDVLHPQPVVTVADLSQLRVRADVDETDFPSIQVGQRVRISADAFEEGKFLTGTVENVSTSTGQKRFSTGEAKERMDVRIIETIIRFDTPPQAKLVKLGLRVTAYFELR